MVNQQLLDYIAQQKAIGTGTEEIRKRLTDSGWPEADIKEALGGNEPPAQSPLVGIDSSAPTQFEIGRPVTPVSPAASSPVVAAAALVETPSMAGNTGDKAPSNKRWLFLVFGILILVGLGFGAWLVMSNKQAEPIEIPNTLVEITPVPQSETETAMESKFADSSRYRDELAGFSIKRPEGWKEDVSGAFGTLVTYASESADLEGDNKYQANMNVVAEQVDDATLEKYIEESKKLMGSTFTNHVLISENPVMVASTPGVILESTFDQQTVKVHNIQLITIKDSKAIIVTGASLDSAWTKYQNLFQLTLASFELI